MEQMVKCPNCGTENPAGQPFCGKCGAKLIAEVQQKVNCPKCGFQNIAGQQFCGSCGAALVATAQQAPAAQAQQASAAPVQQVQAAPPKELPAKTASPATYHRQVEVKPTWGLAWGLWWRMFLLGLLIGGICYLIYTIVMVLAFNAQLPFTL